jgi:hypothetical protein
VSPIETLYDEHEELEQLVHAETVAYPCLQVAVGADADAPQRQFRAGGEFMQSRVLVET